MPIVTITIAYSNDSEEFQIIDSQGDIGTVTAETQAEAEEIAAQMLAHYEGYSQSARVLNRC